MSPLKYLYSPQKQVSGVAFMAMTTGFSLLCLPETSGKDLAHLNKEDDTESAESSCASFV